MSVSTGIENLRPNTEAYTATASLADGGFDSSSSKITGDRQGGLFAAQKNLGKNDFLQLLVAQLQFQDPLSPMENTEFVAQLAQFSALEGNTNIEKAIGKLDDSFQSTLSAQLANAQSMTNASAVSLIGKQVRLQRSYLSYSSRAGEEVPIRVHVGEARGATVRILDDDGEVVRTMRSEEKDAENSVTMLWDGVCDNGERARPGRYTIDVEGRDVNPALYSFVQSGVQGVRFTPQGPLVKIGGQELPVGDIMSVSIGDGGGDGSGPISSTGVELLGRGVRYREEQIFYGGAHEQQMEFSLNMGGARRASVELVGPDGTAVKRWSISEDAKGNLVVVSDGHSETMEGSDGSATLRWNGWLSGVRDYAPRGVYQLQVVGGAANPSMYLYGEGQVTGVNTAGGSTELKVGGRTIPLSSVIGVSLSTEESA